MTARLHGVGVLLCAGAFACSQSVAEPRQGRLPSLPAEDGAAHGSASTTPAQAGDGGGKGEEGSEGNRPARLQPGTAEAASGDGQEGEDREERTDQQVWVGLSHGELVTCDNAEDAAVPTRLQDVRLLLLLDVDVAGTPTSGTLTFGDGPAPPPADDPSAYYPPAASWEWSLCPVRWPVVGFEYPVHGLRIEADRMQLTIYPAQLYDGWCGMQTSVETGAPAGLPLPEFACRSWDATASLTDKGGDLDASFELCVGPWEVACSCDATHCRGARPSEIVLDLLVDGKNMEGRVAAFGVGGTEVRLRRHR